MSMQKERGRRVQRHPLKSDSANRREHLTITRDYVGAGISILPIRADGSKAPAVRSWNQFRERFATDAELDEWSRARGGIGLVCGRLSGGLEVLDFDERAEATLPAWKERLPGELLGRLCIVETGGLGYHVLYRSSAVSGNCKIAMTTEDKVLVESRGEGGYVVGVGSGPGVHASDRPYVQLQGHTLPKLPNVTPEERRLMWQAAASLDERRAPLEEFVRRRAARVRPRQPADPSAPWSDYDRRGDWAEILVPHGWRTRDGSHWMRPGKTRGVSARVVDSQSGVEVLTVFSTNAGVLSPEGAGHRTWGRFSAYAALNHNGDFRAATRAVRQMGYGGAA